MVVGAPFSTRTMRDNAERNGVPFVLGGKWQMRRSKATFRRFPSLPPKRTHATQRDIGRCCPPLSRNQSRFTPSFASSPFPFLTGRGIREWQLIPLEMHGGGCSLPFPVPSETTQRVLLVGLPLPICMGRWVVLMHPFVYPFESNKRRTMTSPTQRDVVG